MIVKAVDDKTWPDLETLFEGRGGPKHCWCMAWRTRGDQSKLKGPGRKALLHARVEAGEPVGLLGYDGDEPVAWVSVAPRSTFRGLGGREGDDERIWSIVCFFIRRSDRGRGLFAQLVAAAEQEAKRHGATAVEAYPVDPDSPSYRFMGFVGSFEEAGYVAVGRAGTRRHVVWKDLPGE